MGKHRGQPKPKWTRPNPAAGRHGVPDKDAKKIGDKWEENARNNPPKKAT